MTAFNRLLLTATLFSAAALTQSAHGAAIISWNTFGNTGTETTEPSLVGNDPGVSAANLLLGPGVTGAGNGNRFGGSSWFDTGDTNPTTLAESIAGNDYIEFTITPNTGFSVSVTSFDFIWDFSSTGPKSVALRSSADGFANDLGSFLNLTTSTSTLHSISISGLNGLTTATTFRLYGFGATAAAGTGGFDTTSSTTPNVVLNGSVSSVPEPSAAVALAGGLGMLMGIRRFRQSRRA